MRFHIDLDFDIDDSKIEKYAKEYLEFKLDMSNKKDVEEIVAEMIENRSFLDQITINKVEME